MEQNKKQEQPSLRKQIDWGTTLIPLAGIVLLGILFMIFPGNSQKILGIIRGFLGDEFGIYYMLMGIGFVLCSLYMAFSRFGKKFDCQKD